MSLVTVNDYGLAGFLAYAQFWLIEVESDRENGNKYTFDMPQEDYDAYLAAWESPEGQHVPNGKEFCASLKKLDALQRQAYRNGGHWADRKYVAGNAASDSSQRNDAWWAAARQSVDARRREREIGEWRAKRDERRGDGNKESKQGTSQIRRHERH